MTTPTSIRERVYVGECNYRVHLQGVEVTVHRLLNRTRQTLYATGVWQPIGGYVRWENERDATSPINWQVADAIDKRLRIATKYNGSFYKVVDAREMFRIFAKLQGSGTFLYERVRG